MMRRARFFLPFTLLMAFLSVAFFVRAVCNPADVGTPGNDTITCDVANPPATDVQGDSGDDVITIDSSVTTGVDFGGDTISAVPGTGSDTIINNGTIDDVYGDSNTGSGSGADVIVNNGTSGALVGDAADGVGSGNDAIVNNGTSADLYGDSQTNNGSGADSITNNGSANTIVGDSVLANGTGNDAITNNGTATNIYGDTDTGAVASGNDTITNNGNVTNIYGDDTAGTGIGLDTITNNGNVGGSIVAGDGADTVSNNGTVNGSIDAGDGRDVVDNSGLVNGNIITGDSGDSLTHSGTVGGSILTGNANDTVTIATNTAVVNGSIDGGAGYDVLTFSLSSTNPADLIDAAQRIAAANPAGGTITLAGHTYTWTNFEELTQLLFSLARINGIMDPLAVFCALTGGVDVYVVSGGQGFFSVNVPAQTLSNGIAQAVASSSLVQVGGAASATVYATPAGTIQVNAPSGFSFSFTYQTYCGTLPAANDASFTAQAGDEEELPAFSIINQPYSR